MIEIIDKQDFAERVESTQGLKIVQFSLPTCGPCQKVRKTLEKWEEEYEGKAKFFICVLNTIDKKRISKAYRVTALPMVITFDGNRIVNRNESSLLFKNKIMREA